MLIIGYYDELMYKFYSNRVIIRRYYSCINIMKPNNKQNDDVLLSIRSKNEPNHIDDVKPSILHQCSNYIVINKPHDIRMDGHFNVTIQKLLLQWIPESTLDSIKWVHQLDYATSGVLCIARNKDAAAIASSSFANRCTEKQYIAILQGRLILDNWPLMSHRLQINEQDDSLDSIVDKKERKKIPTDDNNIKAQWQHDVMNQNLLLSYNAFQTMLKNKGTTLIGFTNETIDEQR